MDQLKWSLKCSAQGCRERISEPSDSLTTSFTFGFREPNQFAKVATTADSLSLFHCFTFHYPKLLCIILGALGQLICQGSTHLIVCAIRDAWSLNLEQTNRDRGYPSFLRSKWHGIPRIGFRCTFFSPLWRYNPSSTWHKMEPLLDSATKQSKIFKKIQAESHTLAWHDKSEVCKRTI